jgi:hypothetical protein
MNIKAGRTFQAGYAGKGSDLKYVIGNRNIIQFLEKNT